MNYDICIDIGVNVGILYRSVINHINKVLHHEDLVGVLLNITVFIKTLYCYHKKIILFIIFWIFFLPLGKCPLFHFTTGQLSYTRCAR